MNFEQYKSNKFIYISLGTYCMSAGIIKHMSNRTGSFPFDWLASNPNNIIKMINNDFKDFLDKKNYINYSDKKPQNGMQCGHSIYGGLLFVHKNPRKDVDCEYYIRCVQRFRDVSKNDEHKIFILLHYSPIENNKLLEINNTLVDYGTKNFKIILINLYSNNERNGVINKINNNIYTINFYHTSKKNGGSFDDINDDLYLFDLIKKVEEIFVEEII
jgi:hypothetical protein